jgi:hypothetical protein
MITMTLQSLLVGLWMRLAVPFHRILALCHSQNNNQVEDDSPHLLPISKAPIFRRKARCSNDLVWVSSVNLRNYWLSLKDLWQEVLSSLGNFGLRILMYLDNRVLARIVSTYCSPQWLNFERHPWLP